jgi:CyaY protein
MNETEFLARSAAVLDSLELQADGWVAMHDLDVETQRSGNVLTFIFDGKVYIIVNSQAPMQEIWVAAPSGGFHYRLAGSRWEDTRGGPHLAQALSQIFSQASGQTISVEV